MRALRTVIVDDEALSRRGIELRLKQTSGFEVVGQYGNGREAIRGIDDLRPDLLFLDIQMPGLSGFDVLAGMQQDPAPMVIFVTAYDQHAVRAFESRAMDYLLKPIDDQRFQSALARAREQADKRDAARQRDRLFGLIAEITGSEALVLDEVLQHGQEAIGSQRPKVLPIRQGRETERLPVSAIDWIDAAGDYMCVHAEGRTHILRGTMKELEELLDPRTFQRVHRSAIVNLHQVKSLRAHMNGEYFLTLKGGHELKLSRTYRDKVEYFLNRNHQV